MKALKLTVFAILLTLTNACSSDDDNPPHEYRITVSGHVEGLDPAEVISSFDDDYGNQMFSDVEVSDFVLTDEHRATNELRVDIIPGIDGSLNNVHVQMEDITADEVIFSETLTKELIYGNPEITTTAAAQVVVTYNIPSDHGEVTYLSNTGN